MSCGGMKNLNLDTKNKQYVIQCTTSPAEELHVTANWFDRRDGPYTVGNSYSRSDGTNLAVVAEMDSCFKKEVSSVSVYNPNADPVTFYFCEYDIDTDEITIIVEKTLGGLETWTTECICECCTEGGGGGGGGSDINAYLCNKLVLSSITGINLCGCGITTSVSGGTVTYNINPSSSYDPVNHILQICQTQIDLSSLASDIRVTGCYYAQGYQDKLETDAIMSWLAFDCCAFNVEEKTYTDPDTQETSQYIEVKPDYSQLTFDCNTKKFYRCDEEIFLGFDLCQFGGSDLRVTGCYRPSLKDNKATVDGLTTRLDFDCCAFNVEQLTYTDPDTQEQTPYMSITIDYSALTFDCNTRKFYWCDQEIFQGFDVCPMGETTLRVTGCYWEPELKDPTKATTDNLTNWLAFDCCAFNVTEETYVDPDTQESSTYMNVAIDYTALTFDCQEKKFYRCDEEIFQGFDQCDFGTPLRVTGCYWHKGAKPNKTETDTTTNWLNFSCCPFNVEEKTYTDPDTQETTTYIDIAPDYSSLTYDCQTRKFYRCEQEIFHGFGECSIPKISGCYRGISPTDKVEINTYNNWLAFDCCAFNVTEQTYTNPQTQETTNYLEVSPDTTSLTFDCNTKKFYRCDDEIFPGFDQCNLKEIYVANTYFVMDNGDDMTGAYERFDLPFKTISGVINDGITLNNRSDINIVVYPGTYSFPDLVLDQTAMTSDRTIHVYLHDGVTLNQAPRISMSSLNTNGYKLIWSVSGHGKLIVDDPNGTNYRRGSMYVKCSEADIHFDEIYIKVKDSYYLQPYNAYALFEVVEGKGKLVSEKTTLEHVGSSDPGTVLVNRLERGTLDSSLGDFKVSNAIYGSQGLNTTVNGFVLGWFYTITSPTNPDYVDDGMYIHDTILDTIGRVYTNAMSHDGCLFYINGSAIPGTGDGINERQARMRVENVKVRLGYGGAICRNRWGTFYAKDFEFMDFSGPIIGNSELFHSFSQTGDTGYPWDNTRFMFYGTIDVRITDQSSNPIVTPNTRTYVYGWFNVNVKFWDNGRITQTSQYTLGGINRYVYTGVFYDAGSIYELFNPRGYHS